MGTVSNFNDKPHRVYNGASEILYTIGATNEGFGWTFESSEDTYKPEEYDACKKVAEDIIKELKHICKTSGHESFGFEFKYGNKKRIAIAFVDHDNISVVNCNYDGTDIRTVFTQEDAKSIELNKGRIIYRAEVRANHNITLDEVFNGKEYMEEVPTLDHVSESKRPLERIKSFVFNKQFQIESVEETKRVEIPSNFELLKSINAKMARYGSTSTLLTMMTQPEIDLVKKINQAKKEGETMQEIKKQLGIIGFYKDLHVKEQNVEVIK